MPDANHTLHVLDGFREEFREFAAKMDKSFETLEKKVDWSHDELKQRIENLHQAGFGESVLGRDNVEERLSALEQRITALELRK